MKSIIIIYLILIGFNTTANISDFEYRISNIVRTFKVDIMDVGKCENLKNDISYLIDDIEEALDDDNYNYDEKLELKKLTKEAEAIDYFISVIGGLSNYALDLKYFDLANKRINSNISRITDEYCVEIIMIEIGNYRCYLGRNKSLYTYSIDCSWKGSFDVGEYSGNMQMGLTKFTIRPICNNRENPKQKSFHIIKMNCNKK